MRILARLAVILLFVSAGVFVWLNAPTHRNRESKEFEIKAGEPAVRVAHRLQKEGLIKSPQLFVLSAKATGSSRKLQKGLYLLSDNMSTWEILDFIAKGKVYTIRVTIPEGYEIRQIARLLEEKKLVSSAKLFTEYALKKNGFSKRISYVENESLEGYLFPSTYQFAKNTSLQKIALTMVQEFSNSLLNRVKSEVGKSPRNFYDLLIVASLVEKEARIPEERSKVAQVYLRRLKKGMHLGACPTVAYAVGKFDGQRLSYADLKVDSPFNTYIRTGLPPTPVCNPGRAAFHAVLHPAETDFLYFVSKNDGSHQFSRTLKEHNEAVQTYQKKSKSTKPQH